MAQGCHPAVTRRRRVARPHLAGAARGGRYGWRVRERFRVAGGASLRGQVRVVGAKNSALKLMAGALLAVGRSRLTNVPGIVDVTIMAELLRRLGCDVEWRPEDGVVEIDVPERIGHRGDYELVRALRASLCVLRPLLTRAGDGA